MSLRIGSLLIYFLVSFTTGQSEQTKAEEYSPGYLVLKISRFPVQQISELQKLLNNKPTLHMFHKLMKSLKKFTGDLRAGQNFQLDEKGRSRISEFTMRM